MKTASRGRPRDRGVASAPGRGHLLEATRNRRTLCARGAAEGLDHGKTIWHINPTGKFYIGGPDGDSGLTGRKIIVDTYGGAPPPAVARSPARIRPRSTVRPLMPRATSPRTSSRRACRSLRVQLAYAIGVARPLSIYIDTHGTGKVSRTSRKMVAEVMDLTPRGIRKHLDLNRPIYARTSSYGHFGRTPDNEGGFSWKRPISPRR